MTSPLTTPSVARAECDSKTTIVARLCLTRSSSRRRASRAAAELPTVGRGGVERMVVAVPNHVEMRGVAWNDKVLEDVIMTRHIGANGKVNQKKDIPGLLRDAQSNLVEECIPAAEALADLGVRDVIPTLTRGLTVCHKYGPPKTAAKVRRIFLECLSKLGESQTVIECLRNGPSYRGQVRDPWLVELLGRYPTNAGIEELLRIVQDAASDFTARESLWDGELLKEMPSYAVTGAAIRSLARLNEERAKTPLYLLLVANPESPIHYSTGTSGDWPPTDWVRRNDTTSNYDRLCRTPAAQALAQFHCRELLEEALSVTKTHSSIQEIIASALARFEDSP